MPIPILLKVFLKNDTAIIIPLEPGTLKLNNLAKNAYKIKIIGKSIAAKPKITQDITA